MANEGAATGAVAAAGVSPLREIPEAIQWHEGMLLSPQHFQQQAARWEGLLQAAVTAQHPFAWGLRQLRLDLSALPGGRFQVRQLEGVFPDGTAVWYDAAENGGDDLAVDLNAAAAAHPDRGLTVYLALPVRGAAAAHGETSRYRSQPGAAVADENTGDGEVEIPRLRPRLRLLAGEAPPARYTSFPIARVEQRDDVFGLTDYVAPTPRVRVESPLYELCAQVAQRLRAKTMFLAERVRAPAVAALTATTWESKRQIQSLVAGLPPFEALLASGQTHPWPLYLAFCGLAGQVATLADSLQPPLFPAYQHDDLRASFTLVRDFVMRAVNEGISEAYLTIPLKQEAGVFSVLFDGAWAERRLALGIRRPAGASESEMTGWGQQCLIGSEEVVPGLREKRILGLRRQLIGPGDELTAGAGVVLFELAPDPAFLRRDRFLQVLNNNPAAPLPAEVVLYVRDQTG